MVQIAIQMLRKHHSARNAYFLHKLSYYQTFVLLDEEISGEVSTKYLPFTVISCICGVVGRQIGLMAAIISALVAFEKGQLKSKSKMYICIDSFEIQSIKKMICQVYSRNLKIMCLTNFL
jgi:hypothetical protein